MTPARQRVGGLAFLTSRVGITVIELRADSLHTRRAISPRKPLPRADAP